MKRVRVEVAPGYEVVIGRGALSCLPKWSGRLAIVVDEQVEQLHGDRIRQAFDGREVVFTTLPSGEKHKTLATAERLFDWLADHRIERSEHLVAIGGGVTGDLAGFVAAAWRRGIPFVQVPTTLLAMVDSSVGGKVAVDHPRGKNLIGAFHHPKMVLADTSFLETLPVRERWAALAEVVKTALLAGEPLYSLVKDSLEALSRLEEPLEEVIAECVAYKAGVVQRDPSEHGERAVLNLGHSVGHALETVGDYEALLHGEAVAFGLRASLALSGFALDSEAMQLVRRLAVPAPPRTSVDEVLEAMQGDKKVVGGQLKFALLDEPGRPRWGCALPPEQVRSVVADLLSGRL